VKLKKPLKKDKSYIIFVEIYAKTKGLWGYQVLYHMPKSDFCFSDEKQKQFEDSVLDRETVFNYEGKTGDLKEILFNLIGDRMGYDGEINDYKYTITQLNSIHEIYETGDEDCPYWYDKKDNMLDNGDE
jgi:hypothetical protein